MSTKKQNDSRTRFIKFRVSDEELEAINRKFDNSGMKSKSDFIRTMILEGHIIIFDDTELKAIRRLVTNIPANVNQIAVRVNSTGNLYAEDVAQIKEDINQLWQPLNYFQSALLKRKR